jgi:hypothetical protein
MAFPARVGGWGYLPLRRWTATSKCFFARIDYVWYVVADIMLKAGTATGTLDTLGIELNIAILFLAE